MDLPNNAFSAGHQPCASFLPKSDGNGYAEWDNRHECIHCAGLVSFCSNCNRDHHGNGYETCAKRKGAAMIEEERVDDMDDLIAEMEATIQQPGQSLQFRVLVAGMLEIAKADENRRRKATHGSAPAATPGVP